MRLYLTVVGIAALAFHAYAQRTETAPPLRISLPDKTWALEITAPGLTVSKDVIQPDGRKYLLASDDPSGLVLSVFLERVKVTATRDGCRDGLHGRARPDGPFKLTNIKYSESGDFALMEYIVPEVNGKPIQQKSVFGCLVKEDVYVDIHISKTLFTVADQPRLTSIMSSARFAAIAGAPTGSSALFAEGSKYFVQNQFDKAIGPYQEALDLEKKEQKLSSTQWRVLVDNLAMAYGITGDSKSAEAVLNYGLSKDPTYPMFYFITADVYAERNDLSNTMKYLRLALMYKSNAIPGESLPDPLKDDSFKRYWNDDEFRKLAAQFR